MLECEQPDSMLFVPQVDDTVLFGKYELLSVLYEGTVNVIYKARRGSRTFVLKVVGHTTEIPRVPLLEKEYSILKHLENNPYVMQPIEFISLDSEAAIVWKEEPNYISLKRFLESHKRFSIEKFLKVARQMAESLHYLHSAGIIHRDISPANFLIHTESLNIKLIDFNASAFWREFVENNASAEAGVPICGTYHYLSPEHTGKIQRQIDYRSDLYSLGIVFYELLLGFPPFTGTTRSSLIYAHAAVRVPPVHQYKDVDIPIVIGKIIGKLVEKHVNDRYQSAIGLIADLDESAQYLDKYLPMEHRTLKSKWLTTVDTSLEGANFPMSGMVRVFAKKSDKALDSVHFEDVCPMEIGKQDKSPFLRSASALYGREQEFTRIMQLWSHSDNESVTVFITGYSGLGKSYVSMCLNTRLFANCTTNSDVARSL
jgi:serine/threonine protein kinase